MPDWTEVLEEIRRTVVSQGQAFDLVRRKYLRQLHEHTRRNVIAYYSGWLAKPGQAIPGLVEVTDEDKNGFMMAINKLDRCLGLDLILHTPGGSIGATHSIIDYLRNMFGKDIRAIVPQIAMSAGTIIACSCKEILLSKHSNLGPIDPQIDGIAAAGVKKEFQRAVQEVTDNPASLPLWQRIIGQYRPTFLSICENAVEWSNDFVKEQLASVMFDGEPDALSKATTISSQLSNFALNKSHSRHLHAAQCRELGLKIRMIEEDEKLQDFVLTVHHCYMHQLTNTACIKVIENHLGAAMIKQVQTVQTVQGLKQG